jgi:hypothetical protein
MAKSIIEFNNFSAGTLSPRLEGRTDLEYYYDGLKELENMSVYVHGGLTKRPGTKYISTAKDSSKPVRLIPFKFSTDYAYTLELGEGYIRFYMDGGQVYNTVSGVETTPYEIATTFSGSDLFDIQYTGVANKMFLVHPHLHPKQLTRYGHTNWTIEDVSFYGGPFLDENTDTALTVAPTTTTGTCTISGSGSIFTDTMVGSYFKISGSEKKSATISAQDTFTSSLYLDTGESLIMSLTGTWSATATLQRSFDNGVTWLDYYEVTGNTSLEITENDDNVYYRLGVKTGNYTSGTLYASISKLNQYGYLEIASVSGTTHCTGTVVKEFPSTDTTYKWSEGAWSDRRGYPSATATESSRVVYASTSYQPQTFWGSVEDDYTNFDLGIGADSDAYSFTFFSNDVNSIQWIHNNRVLLGGTSSGEWKFSKDDEAITPTSLFVRQQSTHGSTNLSAIGIGNSVLYIQQGGNKVRAMNYEYSIDGWVSNEISVRAEHLLREGSVVDWCYSAKPDSMVYMVLDTGNIITCTFDEGSKTIAFSKITTANGYFESVSSIPDGGLDVVWALVKRTINGSTVRYIEYFTTPFWDEQTDYKFMDSSISYTGAPKTTLSGIDHLEGEEVSVLVDGAVHPNCTVSGGAITLQDNYEGIGDTATVHVGKPYTAFLKTMRLNPQTGIGGGLGKRQAIFDVNILFYNTINVKIGSSATNAETIKRFSVPIMDTAPVPFTGAYNVSYPLGYDDELYIYLENDTPTPFTINGIGCTVRAGQR